MNKKLKTLLSVLLTVCMLVSMTNSTVAALYETADPQFGEPVIAGPITDPVIDDPIDHPIIDDPVPNDPITDDPIGDPIGDPEPDDGIDFGFLSGGIAPISTEQNKSADLNKHNLYGAVVKDLFGNVIWDSETGLKGHLTDEQQYVIEYKFAEQQTFRFGGATAQELRELGFLSEFCQEDGKYLYYKVDPSISFDVQGGVLQGNGAIAVTVGSDTYILYEYHAETRCTIGFTGTYNSSKSTDGNVHVYQDPVKGSFTNDYVYPPTVEKFSNAYDLESKTVSYTVRVKNDKNTSASLKIGSITDTIDPKLDLQNLIIKRMPSGAEVPSLDYSYNSGVITFNSDDAKTLAPNEYFEITYTVNVGSLFDKATNIVSLNNTVSVESEGQETVTTTASRSVTSGSIQKTGKVVEEDGVKYVKWEIHVYSPVYQKNGTNHNSLSGVKIEDKLAELDLTIEDVTFSDPSCSSIPVYRDQGYNLSSGVTASVENSSGNLTITLSADDSCSEEHAYLYLYTKYDESKTTYSNSVDGTFPHEDNKKEHSDSGDVTDSGSGSGGSGSNFGVTKTAVNRKDNKLYYKIEIRNLPVSDLTSLVIADFMTPENNGYVYFNTTQALELVSVICSGTLKSGEADKVNYNADIKDKFGVYSSETVGTLPEGSNLDTRSTFIKYKESVLPSGLVGHESETVDLYITYTIDMEKAKIVNNLDSVGLKDGQTLLDYWNAASETLDGKKHQIGNRADV